MGCLYVVSSPSGKKYVGITMRTAEERWVEHCKLSVATRAKALHRAIAKYGADAFTVETLAISNSWEYLCLVEPRAIAAFGCIGPHGYNMTVGGDGVVGMSDEAKETHRANTSIGTKKAWERQSFRDSRAAAINRPEVKARHREATARGTQLAYQSQEVRDRHIAKVTAPDFRARASEQMKALWSDPVYRAHQTAKRRARMKA